VGEKDMNLIEGPPFPISSFPFREEGREEREGVL